MTMANPSITPTTSKVQPGEPQLTDRYIIPQLRELAPENTATGSVETPQSMPNGNLQLDITKTVPIEHHSGHVQNSTTISDQSDAKYQLPGLRLESMHSAQPAISAEGDSIEEDSNEIMTCIKGRRIPNWYAVQDLYSLDTCLQLGQAASKCIYGISFASVQSYQHQADAEAGLWLCPEQPDDNIPASGFPLSRAYFALTQSTSTGERSTVFLGLQLGHLAYKKHEREDWTKTLAPVAIKAGQTIHMAEGIYVINPVQVSNRDAAYVKQNETGLDNGQLEELNINAAAFALLVKGFNTPSFEQDAATILRAAQVYWDPTSDRIVPFLEGNVGLITNREA